MCIRDRTVDNSRSTVGMTIRVRIRINKAKAYDKTTYIGPGESKTLTLLSGIPSATYKLRFIIKDDLSGQKTKGGVKKVLDCVDDPSPTTTTTLPGPPTINPSVSNTRNECSGGAKLTHFHMANSESSNANAYFLAEYSLDGGESWSTLVSNQSVAPGSSEMASVNVPSGQNVRWRYKTSTTSNSFSGGWKRWGPDFTVDCPTTTTTDPTTNTTIDPSTTTTLPDGTTTTTLPGSSTTTTTVPGPIDPEILLPDPDPEEVCNPTSFQELLECIVDPTDPDPTDPLVDDFCEDMILEEGDICEAPLTDEDGNDFLEWDDGDEDIYFTDGSYNVTYIYREDSISLAATGINLDYIVLSGSVFLVGGVILFTSSRKRKLMESEISLEDIYKHAFKLKTKIEKLIQEKVEISIDINKFAPYAKSFTTYQSEIQALDSELQYTLVAIENIKSICKEENTELTKEILEERLGLISNNFQIIYSGNELDAKIAEKKVFSPKKDTKKIKRKFFDRKKLKRPALGFAVLSIITGMGLGIYATQQMFLSNVQQDNAQAYLEQIYLGEEINDVNSSAIFSNPLRFFQSDNPVFETLQDFTVIDQSAKIEEFQPEIFGILEIPDINVNQYVVSGTDELSLQFGPGHYLGTKLPGSGGNVGIAGHRTTYGAPFSRLDLVEVGDQIYLTFGSNKYHYIVDDIEIVDAITGDYVLFNRGDDRLTLTTCHPRYSARQRLVVSGILTRIESGN